MSGVGSQGASGNEQEVIKQSLMCSPDLKKDFTWDEVDGVRVPVQIVFSSALLDAETGNTITLTRSFIYEASDPFDLDEITDVLVVT